jgi:hypothetical protein
MYTYYNAYNTLNPNPYTASYQSREIVYGVCARSV